MIVVIYLLLHSTGKKSNLNVLNVLLVHIIFLYGKFGD